MDPQQAAMLKALMVGQGQVPVNNITKMQGAAPGLHNQMMGMGQIPLSEINQAKMMQSLMQQPPGPQQNFQGMGQMPLNQIGQMMGGQ